MSRHFPVDGALFLWFYGVVTEPKPTLPMIEQTKAYKVGEQVFSLLQDAQIEALRGILEFNPPESLTAENRNLDNALLTKLVLHGPKVIAVLSMQPDKPRKPRSDKGKAHAKAKPIQADRML